jgi:hypothetical protein
MLESYKRFATNRNIGVLTGLAAILVAVYFLAGFSSAAPTETQVYKACQDRCNEIQEAEGQRKASEIYNYCKKTYNIKTGPLEDSSLNQNQTEYCTDGARCPNLNTCETQEATLDMQGCIEYMTSYHQSTQGEDSETAEEHTMDLISSENDETGVGSCNPKPEWYQQVIEE